MAYRQISPLPINNGGTNTETFAVSNGVVLYNGTSLISVSSSTAGYVLTSNGAGAPTFQAASGGGIGTLDGNTGSATGPTVTIAGSGVVSTSATSATLTIVSTAANVINATTGSATASSNAFSIVGGTGITTSATGSTVTITASGGGSGIYPFSNTTGATQAMAVNTGYVANDGATLVTFTLPATASVGQVVAVQGAGTGLWTLAQNAGQSISFNSVTSTVGAGGSLSSTSQFDSVYLMCVTANTAWAVNNSVGNLSVI